MRGRDACLCADSVLTLSQWQLLLFILLCSERPRDWGWGGLGGGLCPTPEGLALFFPSLYLSKPRSSVCENATFTPELSPFFFLQRNCKFLLKSERVLFSFLLGIRPWALPILGKCFTTNPELQIFL